MRIILLSLLLFGLPIQFDDTYQIVWCSAEGSNQKALRSYLDALRSVDDKEQLDGALTKWREKFKITKPLVVIRTARGFYKWPFPGSKKALFYKESAGVLGTRSMDEPTLEDISCFFSDTLVVVDTLRFYTGLPASRQLALKIADKEYVLPVDRDREELLISSGTIQPAQAQGYQQVAVVEKTGDTRKEIARCVIYFLDQDERLALKAAFKNKETELADCDSLLKRSVPFLLGFYGSKGCDRPGKYYQAQAKALKRLISCQ